MKKLLLVFLVIGIVQAPRMLSAQVPADLVQALEIGSRVRITASEILREPLVGSVRRVSPDTLFLRAVEGPTTAVPITTISHLEVSAGRRYDRGRGRGMAVGAVVGGLGLGLLVLAGVEFCVLYETCLRNDLYGAAGGFALGSIPGGLIGVFVGVPRVHEDWRVISFQGDGIEFPMAHDFSIRISIK